MLLRVRTCRTGGQDGGRAAPPQQHGLSAPGQPHDPMGLACTAACSLFTGRCRRCTAAGVLMHLPADVAVQPRVQLGGPRLLLLATFGGVQLHVCSLVPTQCAA